MPYTQKHRTIAVGTPLGEDVLLLRRFTLADSLSQPFELQLDLASERSDIVFGDILGQNVTVRVELPDGGTRYLNGIVSRFGHAGHRGRLFFYQATVVPWLWLLTRTADCRIFQDATVPDIVTRIFREKGFTDFRLDLSSSYRQREYCVQYRESDFNFASRLLEQEGIYYYFEHENGRHVLVLADSSSAHRAAAGYATIPFRPQDEGVHKRDFVFEFRAEDTLQSGAYELTDFDFKAPRKNLRATIRQPAPHALSDLPVFDYPGDYTEFDHGRKYAQVRLQELLAQHRVYSGLANCRGLAVGHTFKLEEFPVVPLNQEYLLIETRFEVQGDALEPDSAFDSDKPFCSVQFSAIELATPFRSPSLTSRPIVQGPQTALVVGKAGEEIWTDQFGRVKVKFHWDRYSKADETSSCWIRVSQNWASKKWGTFFLPRIGQEVIVEFLEGDPDRPIVTGCVYNGDAPTPYDLPKEATKSTLKSNTSKGGNGFNEIRFEDKKGKEQIFIHGQRDLDLRVRDDIRETNLGDRDITVGGGAKGNLNTTVAKDVNTHVIGGQFEQVDKQLHQTVKEDVVEDYQKNQSTLVKEKYQLNAKEIIIEGGKVISLKSGKITIQGAQGVHIKGAKVAIEGSAGVSLKVGGNFVSVTPSGVAIKGSAVLINSGGSPLTAEAAQAVAGPEIQAPLAACHADDGKTGGALQSNGGPAAALKRAITPVKAPDYIPPQSLREQRAVGSAAPIAAPSPNLLQKIDRRQQRLALVERGQKPGAPPRVREAADRLQRNMDGVEKAKLAADSYHWVEEQKCPEGWTRGSENPEELRRKYGIDYEMLAPSDCAFRAEIYEPDPLVFGPDAKPVLVFKGTTFKSAGDWIANLGQGTGFETEHYNRAMSLARKLDRKGVDYEVAGHSLGGGLATAAAAASGSIRTTTTFNAAGLNSKTVDRRGAELSDASQTNAYRVDGEILTYLQEEKLETKYLMPNAIGAPHELRAPAGSGIVIPGIIGAPERVERHSMTVVIQAIEEEKARDQATLSCI